MSKRLTQPGIILRLMVRIEQAQASHSDLVEELLGKSGLFTGSPLLEVRHLAVRSGVDDLRVGLEQVNG